MIVRRCEGRDLPEVFDLYRRTLPFPPAEKLEQYWRWKLLSNPHHRGEHPPFWVAREGDALVGGMAEIPVVLELDGQSVAAAWAADFMIDPRFQGRGMGTALFDHYRRQNHVAISMGYAPGSPTSRVARALGFIAGPPLRYMFRLLTTRPVTRRLTAARTLGAIIDRLSRGPLRRFDRLPRHPPPAVRVEEMASFGPSFDALWATVSHETTVSVRRDHTTMNWRYHDNPFHRYRTLAAWSRDTLAGCLVFKVVRHSAFTYATIAELVVPAGAREVQDALLVRTLEEFRREEVDVVKTLASAPHLVRGFRRAGFYALGTGSDFVMSVAPVLRTAFATHLDPHTWYLTKGDCDLDMVPDFMSHLPTSPA
jgi:GNAT superfamily N-acetyltransferase